jgi:hypothetical protein
VLFPAIGLAVLLAQATVPQNLDLTVTGNPASGPFLERTIRAALQRTIRPTLPPGASARFGPVAPLPVALAPGFIASASVPVAIAAPAGDPLLATTNVNLTNAEAPAAAPVQLVFDDDPEYVAANGMLAQASVDAERPTRLYYYHADTGLPKDIAVVLTSTAQTRVHLIDAHSGPDLDVMNVGDQITRDFLEVEPHNEGIIADVQPGTPFVLKNSLTLAAELVAGTVDVRVLMGAPVTVSVVAYSPGTDLASALQAPPVARDGHNRHGTFDLTGIGSAFVDYTAGAPDATYTIGGATAAPSPLPGTDGSDTGAYGVVHHVAFTLRNPAPQQQTVYLYERAHGGPVRASYLIDGTLMTMGCARVPTPYLITFFVLDPQSQRTVSLLTMADGGSNFPLDIGATTTPPQPQTPPQNAPDGCFPKPSAPQ